jgi:hypothetical protein
VRFGGSVIPSEVESSFGDPETPKARFAGLMETKTPKRLPSEDHSSSAYVWSLGCTLSDVISGIIFFQPREEIIAQQKCEARHVLDQIIEKLELTSTADHDDLTEMLKLSWLNHEG